jgi:tetratricopeptide (TPR) repeat protein
MKWRMSLTVVIAILSAVLFSTDLSSADKAKADAVAAPQADANSAEAKVEASLAKMRELVKARKWSELVEQFKDEDIASWTAGFKDKSVAVAKAAEAANLRGQAHAVMNNPKGAEKDLKLAVDLTPGNGGYWFNLAETYMNLKDEEHALDAYNKSFGDGKKGGLGWIQLSATINAATILSNQGKFQEALKIMERYDDSDIKKMQESGPVWGKKMIETNARIYAGLGRKGDAFLVLADKGNSEYQIVVPDKYPTPAIGEDMKQVARLLQTAFKSNGAEVAVVAESARDSAKPAIYLGDTAFAKANGVEPSKIEGWNYVHKVVGKDVIVAGREQPAAGGATMRNSAAQPFDRIGTAKATADFLRLYAGTRFLYPDVTSWGNISNDASVDWLKSPAVEFLPSPTIRLPSNLDVMKKGVLEYNIGWAMGAGFYELANNRLPIVDDVFGCHTYGRAVPPAKYGKTNPEYFALVGGKRISDVDQYCISNPEVQELFYQDLLKWLDAGYKSVDLGQPDGFRPCQCDNCKKLFDTGSDWSEKLWILHRNLAERVLKARPDKQVTLMAYMQTETPPKTFKTFPKNTRIMMCGTNEEDIAPWRAYEVPGGFTAYIYNWCPNLGTRYTPMRTPRYVEAQAKRFFSNHFQSINRDGPGALYGLEGPVYYTMGRMFDDPANNQAKDLVNEFCGGAFGKAAPAMSRFYDQLYHGIELYSEYLGTRCPAWAYTDIYGRGHKSLNDPFQFLGFLYSPALLASLEKDLAQAEKVADTDKIKTRLGLVRREFNYVKNLARVIHLYHAYEIQPDVASRDRLLDAIDVRNAEIAAYYDPKNIKELTNAGWAYTLFPFPGHSKEHLQLAYDGYQEPFKNTCVNWDTKAMRKAPLPGANRLAVKPGTGAVTIDAPAWESAVATVLRGLPQDAKPTRKTTLKTLYDNTGIYLLVDSELPADLMKTPSEKEAVVVYIAPPTGKDISYKFTVGPKLDAKTDAACGFVTDVMDPRHGQFDPDWSGDWTYETKLEPEKNRWLALIKVPFKTLGVEAPAAGTNWRANVGRVHLAGPDKFERSIWSSTPSTKDMDDKSVFGEMVFETGAASAAAKNPMQAWREEYNGKSSEIPAEWKTLPNPLPTPLGPWLFRGDQIDQGLKENWFAVDANVSDWIPVKVPAFWAENEAVGNYQGYGWYRTTFSVPEDWKGKTLRLLFAGVDEQAWIYVNGKLVKEHTEKSEGKSYGELWEEPFNADVSPENLNYGKPNVLVVRVSNAVANGGIWRPVLGCAVDKK